jgi:hypothetical protein
MPFSTTASCTEEEWTLVFETVFQPAIEGAGLNYECNRSTATRGNIVGAILEELKESYVVLADLTDHNPNVFYELGVRHSLRDRTILVAQKEQDIPFDLRAYAYHIYDWRTGEGQKAFHSRIAELLSEIDTRPDRPDNPVSDFLGRSREPGHPETPTPVRPQEVSYAQPLVGPSAEGLNAAALAQQLARSDVPRATNTVLRLTRTELRRVVSQLVNELNQRKVEDRVSEDRVPEIAQELISPFEPAIQKVEEFVLASVEEQWEAGARLGLKLSGDLISSSERRHSGRSLKPVQGAPALLAWRLLLCSGARALAEESFSILGMVLKEPIEVEDASGRFSNQSLVERGDLFWPEAFMGNAYHGTRYMIELWDRAPHLHEFFPSREDWHFQLAKFYMVAALTATPDESGHPLYPGYRLFPEARRAMSSLCSRLANSTAYLEGIAQALGESATFFQQSWSERAAAANSVGTRHPLSEGPLFPDPMDA